MSFRSILKSIVEDMDGAMGALILGYDGIPIDEYIKEVTAPIDMQLLAVEYTSLLKEVKRTVEVLQCGEMEEVSICSGDMRVIVSAINNEFFIVLAMRSDGNYGKGRFLLKRSVPQLRPELQ